MPPWYPNGKSPFLKTLVFDTERPSFFRYRTPDDDSSKEPALVGVLAAARLALRPQRFRTDGCILNFDGAFYAETIERSAKCPPLLWCCWCTYAPPFFFCVCVSGQCLLTPKWTSQNIHHKYKKKRWLVQPG